MDTPNKFLVGAQGDHIVIGLPMRAARMSRADALLLAAYLVAMAEPFSGEKFADVLHAVENA